MAAITKRGLSKPVLFICDVQEKFRPGIWEFDKIILTTQKLLRAATLLSIPIYATTQNRARLGPTCPELGLDAHPQLRAHADKTAFSMWPPLAGHFPAPAPPAQVALVGIESHICVTQTALDLLAAGHGVYVLADAVSSCHRGEVPIALARLRAAGAVVTTSESFLYEVMGDAVVEGFKGVVGLVKETGEETGRVLEALSKM